MHLSVSLADALLVAGDPGRALHQVEQGLIRARQTSSMKYVARCHVLRGEIALAGGDAARAAAELETALRIARDIAYPTLTWQTAHLLARAQVASGRLEAGRAHADLAAAAITRVGELAPTSELRHSFFEWPRVQAALEHGERLRA
jgi:ATP/maltotriose-dependent transcriptional regulator MalT